MSDLSNAFLGAFDYRSDDYVGRPMIVGCLFSSTPEFPAKIQQTYNPDARTLDTAAFHQAWKSVVDRAGSDVKYFAFYRNEVTDADHQFNGDFNHIVTLDLKLTATVTFESTDLAAFLTNGFLDTDPPVIDFAFSDMVWLDGDVNKQKFAFGIDSSRRPAPSSIEEGQLLVGDSMDVELALCHENLLFSPRFRSFTVVL